ncbi:MAG: FAD:protein FMN transferase [Planctomycetaceae bacterium]|jgi:thiamine biosynthesis lipoprotein|nr:FAD:protein FMN transferase [Planctomycetaceae bacterium]
MQKILFVFLLLSYSIVTAEEPFEFEKPCMGLPVRVLVFCGVKQDAATAADAAFKRFDDIDAAMSDYRSDSEIVLLTKDADNDTEPTWRKVSDDVFMVLTESKKFYELSDGTFDVTIAPLTRLWRRSRRNNELPSDELLTKSQTLVGFKFVELDEKTKSIRLQKKGIRFDFGGIAKGYALDEAANAVKKTGVKNFLIDAGGDIVAGGTRDKTSGGWKVAVGEKNNVEEFVNLKDNALAVSGDTFQFVELNGTRYSHILDPKTGLGVTTPRFAAVRSDNATTADVLASIMCVLGAKKGIQIIERLPNTEAMVIENGKREMSSGW